MTFRPILATFDAANNTLRILPRFRAIAAKQFENGEEYPLEVVEQRSSKEHARYFAAVGEAWNNIRDPETISLLGGPDGLRHWALIQTGWCYTTAFGPLSEGAAISCGQRAAVDFRRLLDENTASKRRGSYLEVARRRSHDEETGEINGWAVVVKTPMSQSRAAMKKEQFRESSRAVLDVLAGTIEVKRKDLERAGKAVVG